MAEEKRLYELINPSDRITFRATVAEAAFIESRMSSAMYFVEDCETGKPPHIEDIQQQYDSLWFDGERLASYAAAYRSFLVGSQSERELFEEAVSHMSDEEAAAYRARYHERRATSMNDICSACWETAEKIAAYQPEVKAHHLTHGEPR